MLDFEPSAFPTCECCVTSPPFIERTDDRNPFRNYAGESSYEAYLDDVETAFRNIRHVLTDGSRVAVSVANIKYKRCVTPLAWDIADRLSSVFHFDGEIVITWEGVDDGDSHFGYG